MTKPLLESSLLIGAMIALWVILPYSVQATSPSETGIQVTLNGVLYFAYGTESCSTQQTACTAGESVMPYLALPNGDNYILVGGKVDIWPDGTRMLVTGWVIAPTGTAPSLSFVGDIIVTSIYAHCHMHQ